MLENNSIFLESQKAFVLSTKEKNEQEPNKNDKVAIIAKADKLVTMSGLPPSHWKTLFHLELVRERNKPKEAPKKPPSAPFFLQWRGENTNNAFPSETESKMKGLEDGGADKKDDDAWDAVWDSHAGCAGLPRNAPKAIPLPWTHLLTLESP